MKAYFSLPLALLILCSFTLVQSQRTPVEKNRRETVQQEQLKKLMSKVGVDVAEIAARTDQPATYRELKINWSDSTKSTTELRSASDQQTPPQRVSVVEDKKRSGTLPRHRSLELSPTHIFIAAVDATDKLRWWSIMPDPRLVRGETQTPSGELRGEAYYVSNVTLVVAFPDDPEIANLRFYHPVWNGTDFDLKPLAVVSTR
ncbi:MAG TPA: hypothetical protein VJ306_13510 [Pyrinomonadaceae bacterium]|jgi:hypothetical protein|nr:hypothetical protein [Pyrinomonadaceae bacterium]